MTSAPDRPAGRRSQEAAPGYGRGARAAGSAPPGGRPVGRVAAGRAGPDLAGAAVGRLHRLPHGGRVPGPLGLPAPGRQRRPIGGRPGGRMDPAGRGVPPVPARGAEGRADRGDRRADRGPRPAARPARLDRRARTGCAPRGWPGSAASRWSTAGRCSACWPCSPAGPSGRTAWTGCGRSPTTPPPPSPPPGRSSGSRS